ncbi:MAG: hypothetical protein ACE5ER_11200 [Nitrospinaceae bacterium]
MNPNPKQDYEFTYDRLFNILFHIGVVINVGLVLWLYLVFLGVI